MTSPRLVLCCLAGLALSGCASVIPYTPKETVLDELGPEQACPLLESTLTRAVEPRVASAHADPAGEFLHYTYLRTIHGPFGIPVGDEQRELQFFYVNLDRVEVYDNHYVYVYGFENRLIAKLLFETGSDATGFADLVMSFRARRVYGGGGATAGEPGPDLLAPDE